MMKHFKTYLAFFLICSCGYSSLYKTNNELLNYRINIIVKTKTKRFLVALDESGSLLNGLGKIIP